MEFQILQVTTTINQNIDGYGDRIIVRFKDRSLIQDLRDNHLKTEVLSAAALRQIKLPAQVSGMGEAVQTTTFITLGIMLGMSLFQSVAMDSFWNFINMLQIINYLPVIPCILPENFIIFLTEYLTMGELAIPFDLLPDWFPSPEKLFEYLDVLAIDIDIELYGFESVSFLYNFVEELTTWLLIALFYIAINLLLKIKPQSE